MGYYLTEQATETAAETRTAARRFRPLRPSRLGAKTRKGVPTGKAILSTKYADEGIGLVYYGYRFYSSELGRWLSRDPIGDIALAAQYAEDDEELDNLYRFLQNDPVANFDPFGLQTWDEPPEDLEPLFQGSAGKICCGGKQYDKSTECCENNAVVAKVSIWVCRRKLGGPDSVWPKIGPLSHTFVVCEDPQENPNTQEKYGKQPRPKNTRSPIWGPGYIEREPWSDFRDCRERNVCPVDKKRMCKEGPTDWPYFLPSPWNNCHAWGNCRSK